MTERCTGPKVQQQAAPALLLIAKKVRAHFSAGSTGNIRIDSI